MANINNLKIGANNPNAIMFDDIYIQSYGDELFNSWYKYSGDGGGYYVHGLTLLPSNGDWNIYWWPWDLGITSGGLKDVDGGSHNWGYVQDGINKNLTGGINKSFPDNGWGTSGWNASICFYGNAHSNSTIGSYNAYDFGDHPIVIKFLDSFIEGCTFTIMYNADITISEDKRTVTIRKVKANDRALKITWKNNSLDFIRQKLSEVRVDITGLSYHYKILKVADNSSVECWDANIGDTKVYHKDKTVENCWIKYGMITDTWKGDDDEEPTIHDYYKMNMAGVSSELDGYILPETVDYENYILPKDNSGIKPIQWAHAIFNTEFWDNIKNYLLTHPVIMVEDFQVSESNPNYSNYTSDNNNNRITNGWFNGSNLSGDLTIKFDGCFANQSLRNWIIGTTLDTLTLQFLQDNLKLSVSQFMFRDCTIKTIKVLDKNGNPSNKFIGARDCSGMCEKSDISYFPDIIDWNSAADVDGMYGVPLQYAFSYCYNLTEIAQHGDDRTADSNNIRIIGCAQSFQLCNKLTKIGPVLRMDYLNLRQVEDYDSPAYKMFEDCIALTDVRIYGLNGNYVNFDDNNQHGYLPSLDAESIKYLFDNLTDLTTYNPDTAISSTNNDFLNNGWQYYSANWCSGISTITGAELRARNSSHLYNARRMAESSDSSFFYTTQAINNSVRVSGLQDNDILIWDTGGTQTNLSNGTTAITNVAGTTGRFLLKRTGAADIVNDYEHIVNIELITFYNPNNAKAASAQLHCPSEWFGIFNLAKCGSIEGNRGKVSSNVLTATGRIAPTSNNSVWISVRPITSIKFKVEGLVEGDTIAVGRGNLSEVANKYTEDGTYTIDEVDYNPTNNSWGIKLFNENTSLSDEVTVTILQVNDFTNKVTSEMIAAANAKNWHIYVDGTEKVS